MNWAPILRPILAVSLGLGAGLLVTFFAGENPLNVAVILFNSAFGSWYDFGMTLFYTTPLIFTGLSVAIAFRAGLFNIGAEGQLTLGALGAVVIGSAVPDVAWPWAPILAIFFCILFGGLWGAIPGYLRAKRGSHEVITTIMMNFIAAGIASYVTLYLLKNPESQNPETIAVGANYLMSKFEVFEDAPVSSAIFIAIAACVAIWVLLEKTVLGFEIQAVGENEKAARVSGIKVERIQIVALAIAGALAGLVGVGEVLGNSTRFKLGFSPSYGFIGIAVALLGRGKPFGVLGAAFLFGALHKGASDLDFETENITRELSFVLQALVILSVSADGLWGWLSRYNKKKEAAV